MDTGPMATLAVLGVIAILTIIAVWLTQETKIPCPTELRKNAHGEIKVFPGGRSFPDMNGFNNWWYSIGLNKTCPMPKLVQPTKYIKLTDNGDYTEQTYTKTPINKVDDYEFSRVFGHQYGNEMVVDQDYNKILLDRNTDWSNRPISSDERKTKYRGLEEGFTAEGDLRGELLVKFGSVEEIEDAECKVNRNSKKVARLVEKVYASEGDWEPVVVQTGPNNWEVNELKPRRREAVEDGPDRIFNPKDEHVKMNYRYPDQEAVDAATDPYYKNGGWKDVRDYKDGKDPYNGVVPNMARMFGPTLDNQDWLNRE